MKLAAFLIVIGLIATGLILPFEKLALVGAGLFLLVEIIDLISLYIEAKKFRSDERLRCK
jgi:hypothetical protein